MASPTTSFTEADTTRPGNSPSYLQPNCAQDPSRFGDSGENRKKQVHSPTVRRRL